MSRFTAPLRLRTRTSLVAAAALVAGLLAIPALPASAAGPATHFSVSADPSVAAGDALPFTVTALDASDVTADGYTGTVHVTVNNAQVGETVPQDYEFQAGDAGVANLTGILTLAGTRTITVTDASDSDISGHTGVDVTPGDATQLAFSSQPSDTFTQHQLGAVSVKITDAYGNQTADNDSIQLSVNTGSFDAGTNPKNASGGAVTFSDLEIDTPGTYTLDASDTTNETVTGATSDSFDILAHADIALDDVGLAGRVGRHPGDRGHERGVHPHRDQRWSGHEHVLLGHSLGAERDSRRFQLRAAPAQARSPAAVVHSPTVLARTSSSPCTSAPTTQEPTASNHCPSARASP